MTRPAKRSAHRQVLKEMMPVVQSVAHPTRRSRAIGLPANNVRGMIKEQELLFGEPVGHKLVAVEEDDTTYRRIKAAKGPLSGQVTAHNRTLGSVLRSQPKDGRLIHLDADLCSTWRKAPTSEILSLFGGAFDRQGGSMVLTLTMNCPHVYHHETWHRAHQIAHFILSRGLHCQMVPVAYPRYYGGPKTAAPVSKRGNNGHVMLRLGYTWFPPRAGRSPSLQVTSPSQDFGVPQLCGGPSLGEFLHKPRSEEAIRRFFHDGTLPLAQDL